METLFIPNERDFKQWIKDAMMELLTDADVFHKKVSDGEEPLLSRKEIAAILHVSLVTLTDWMKRGLPFHRQRGRVYFMRSEIMEYLKKNHLRQVKFSPRYIETD